MGSAIAQRIKAQYEIYIFDKDKNKTAGLPDINCAHTNADLVNKVEAVVLAVKPQDFDPVLAEIKNLINDKLIISIAAGITTAYIEKYLGKVRLIRVMPNLPAKIGEGISCICKGKFAGEADLNFAQEIFAYLGKTIILSEEMLNAATAISGSGPGYFYDFLVSKAIDYRNIPEKIKNDFIAALSEAAKNISFNFQQAGLLAEATISGSISLLKATQLTPQELRGQVTSPGGTTQAALEVLHKGGSLTDAVKAALKRARELSRKG
jgi:pyrroline-5-carboxylate reductase